MDFEFEKELLEVVQNLRNNLKKSKAEYERYVHRLENKKENLEAKSKELADLGNLIEIKKQSIELLNAMGQVFEETSVRRRIEDILKQIMKTLFNREDCYFSFIRKTMRKQQEIYIYRVNIVDGEEFLVPIKATPGGMRDICDIVQRILILRQRPENERFLGIDEPMKNLSKDLQADFFKFVKRLCREFGIQVFLITHEPAYIDQIDTSYKFTNSNNQTHVRKNE